MIVLSSLFPVFSLILLGAFMKRADLTDDAFLKRSDRMVYYIFFPAMLFWKIGGADPERGIDLGFCLASFCALFLVYIASALCVRIFHIPNFKVGSFSQGCYRFNTYIGMAVILNALGEEGVRHFGLLIGFIIPVINILAVSTLIWFSGKDYSRKKRLGVLVKSLAGNPLILACVFGMVYSRLGFGFPVFLDNTFGMLSLVTLPLALISIGGALTFKSLGGNLRLALIGSSLKLLVFPGAGYLFLRLFGVTEPGFSVAMIFFCLPASTAIYVLSSQLSSDTELASALIVVSTVLSFFTLSAVLMMGGA